MEYSHTPLTNPVTFEADFNLDTFYLTKGEHPEDVPTEESIGNRVVEGYASTTDLDAQRHIITEDAIKQGATSLQDYRTILFNHDPNRPIGKLVAVEPRDNRLWIKVIISKSEPLIWEKIKDGTLSKFSVKGKILGAEKQLQLGDDGSPDPKREILIIKSMELYEVSLVSIPANSKARSLMWYIEKALEKTPIEVQEEPEANVESLKADFPWLEDVLKEIDEVGEITDEPVIKSTEDNEEIDINNIDLEKYELVDVEDWVEQYIPLNTPLKDFEAIKEAAMGKVAAKLGAAAAGAGRWITSNGRKIFLRGKEAAKKAKQAATSERGKESIKVGVGAAGVGAVASIPRHIYQRKKDKKMKKDADVITPGDNETNIDDNDRGIDIDEIANEIEEKLKGGELFMDVLKNADQIDGAIASLMKTVDSGEIKGEDLDQVQSVINALKSMRVRLYGVDETPAEKAVEVKTEDQIEKSVAETPKEVDALKDVIEQLQAIVKNVTDQAKSVTEQTELVQKTLVEVTTVKTDIAKAIEGITKVVDKIPLRRGQNPEDEEDRNIEKSVLDLVKKNVGGEDAYKALHPSEKLYQLLNTKINSQ